MSVKISAVIITYNEERHIGRCIESLSDIADEVIVVDSHSRDRTVAIAEALGARVVVHDFAGYSEQKNYAMELAAYDHIISLDADEALSIELSQEIAEVKNHWAADAYRFNRLNRFCGRWIKHGLWYPDRKIRLWNRQKGRWGGRNLHEKMILQPGSSVRFLRGDLLHYTVERIDEYFNQVNKYSSIQAAQFSEEGFRPNFFHLILKPVYKFLVGYVFRLGFLDGWRGYMIALGQALGVYLRYAKIRQDRWKE